MSYDVYVPVPDHQRSLHHVFPCRAGGDCGVLRSEPTAGGQAGGGRDQLQHLRLLVCRCSVHQEPRSWAVGAERPKQQFLENWHASGGMRQACMIGAGPNNTSMVPAAGFCWLCQLCCGPAVLLWGAMRVHTVVVTLWLGVVNQAVCTSSAPRVRPHPT